MITSGHLRELIIKPTLEYLGPCIPFSYHAVELLMMTAAHESHLGTYLKQVKGPALGIYQMEPATAVDIYDNYLRYNKQLKILVDNLSDDSGIWIQGEEFDALTYNLVYATAMTRVHYYRDSEPLPSGNLSDERTIVDLAQYAKRVYNTVAGKATAQDYYDAYMKRCF